MKATIALYDGFTALDVIGPYQVLTLVPDIEVMLGAHEPGTIQDDAGLLRLEIPKALDEVTDPDLILVPGGLITRRLARTGHPIIDWVRRVHPGTRYTTSVCSGALLLGAAGVLQGVSATTHWCEYDALAGYGAKPSEVRVVREGRIWTAAGVSAGIDLALALVADISGVETAQAVQLAIEYDPQPPFDAGSPSTAPKAIVDLVRTITEARVSAMS